MLRPLLGITKAELVTYMKERGHAWREDASNQERDYTRNKVRLDLIPMLQSVAGGPDALNRSPPLIHHTAILTPLYRRITSLSEQSLELRTHLDKLRAAYVPPKDASGEYFLAVPCPSTTTFVLTPRFHRLPALSQGDLLHDFITGTTRDAPPYHAIRKLMSFIEADEADPHTAKRRAIDISDQWSVVKVGAAVRLVDKLLLRQTQASNYTITHQLEEGLTIVAPKDLYVRCRVLRDNPGDRKGEQNTIVLHNVIPGTVLSIR